MSSQPTISIIIPAYNEEKLIEQCLKSIKNQTVAPYEVIVVDNNCTDTTVQIAKNYGARIVKESRQGITYARTTGFNSAKGSIIGRIDADSYLKPTWIETLINTFENTPETVAITGSTALWHIGKNTFLGRWLFYILLRKSVELPYGISPWLFGHNMAVRRAAWDKIKEKVSLGDKLINEDLDLTLHLKKVGELRYIHNLIVRVHMSRQLFQPKKIAAYTKATQHTIRLHRP